jgi:hypothetical protein
MEQMDYNPEKKLRGRMVVGGMLIIAGTLLLLQHLDIIYIGSLWQYWPFILCLMGVGKMVYAYNAREFGAGIWFIFLGLWLYVSINHLFGLSFRETWPAILIAWGCSLIWKSFFHNSYRWVKG